MDALTAPVALTLHEIGHMLQVVWHGRDGEVLVGYTKDNLVMTGLSALTTRPADVIVPLVLGIVIAGLYTYAIEGTGYAVARLSGVGAKLLQRIEMSESKGDDASALRAKYDTKLETFGQSFTETVFYGIDLFIAYRLFWGEHWSNPLNWSDTVDGVTSDGNVASIPGVQKHYAPREMRAYYIIEFGFYASQLIAVLSKKRKKDFVQMVFHHLLTCLLIALSYSIGYLRIGIIVMVCHSAFDPFLNAAKCFHYMFPKSSPWHMLADINFALCALTFFIFRFGFYPWVIYCAWALNPAVSWDKCSAVENSLKIMLVMLLPIHIFWFYLIIRVLVKALGGGTVQGDARSDDEDSDDDEEEAKNK